MSFDAKNSIFAFAFVIVFFGTIYSTWDSETGQMIFPVLVAILFGFAKRFVLRNESKAEEVDG